MNKQEMISFIDSKLALCNMDDEDFRRYQEHKFGVRINNTYPGRFGIAEAALEIIKGQLELDLKMEEIENERL